jgi:hypothetical protein
MPGAKVRAWCGAHKRVHQITYSARGVDDYNVYISSGDRFGSVGAMVEASKRRKVKWCARP